MDTKWEIWDGQALTSEEFSHTNGNLLDLEEDGVTDECIDGRLWLNIKVGTAFAGLDSGCYIAVVTSDSGTFASGVWSPVAIGAEDAPLLVAQLAAGAVFSVATHVFGLHKYLGLLFEPISEAASAGALDAWFGLGPISPVGRRQKARTGYTM